jgi:hypothetical protein
MRNARRTTVLLIAALSVATPAFACGDNEGFDIMDIAPWIPYYITCAAIAFMTVRAHVRETAEKRFAHARLGICTRNLPNVDPMEIFTRVTVACIAALMLLPFERLGMWVISIATR